MTDDTDDSMSTDWIEDFLGSLQTHIMESYRRGQIDTLVSVCGSLDSAMADVQHDDPDILQLVRYTMGSVRDGLSTLANVISLAEVPDVPSS